MVTKMTNKQRTMNILNFENADRMPAVHFGYWTELLAEWSEQGHISKSLAESWGDGNDADRELDKILGWDFNWHNVKSPQNMLYPKFEHKILERLPGGFLRVQNSVGLIERIKEGVVSIPAEDDYQLKDRDAYEALYKDKMQFCDERIDTHYFSEVFNKEERDYPVGLMLGSLLGQIRNMVSVMGLSYLLYDDYDLFKEIVDTYADMQYKCTKAVLETGAKFDFAHYWEDICFVNGPLISPVMFDDLCAHHYKKRNELVRDYGIKIISLDCDGVTDTLQKTWFDNGVNTMFPIEVGTWGDQFEKSRIRFGNEMRGVGAMDKTAFRKDKVAVDEELLRMEKLAKMGGFIPCPDHRIMPGSDFELVRYYAEKIKQINFYSEK